MNRFISIVLSVLICFGIFNVPLNVHASEATAWPSPELNQPVTLGDITYTEPSNYIKEESDGIIYYYPSAAYDGYIDITCSSLDFPIADSDAEEDFFTLMISTIATEFSLDYSDMNIYDSSNIAGYPARRFAFHFTLDSSAYDVIMAVFITSNYCYVFSAVGTSPMDASGEYILEDMLYSITGTDDAFPSVPEIYADSSVVYDDNNLKISAAKIEETDSSYNVTFIFENTSEMNRAVGLRSYAVNSCMAEDNDDTMYTEVPAGKKAMDTLIIEKSWLSMVHLQTIEYMDLLFWVYEEGVLSFETDVVKLKTTLYDGDYSWGYNDRQSNYEDEYISVYGTITGTDNFTVSVINNNTVYLYINIGYLSVNEWAYDINSIYDIVNEIVFPACIRYYPIPVGSDFFETHAEEQIDNVEFTIDVNLLGESSNAYTTSAVHIEK